LDDLGHVYETSGTRLWDGTDGRGFIKGFPDGKGLFGYLKKKSDGKGFKREWESVDGEK